MARPLGLHAPAKLLRVAALGAVDDGKSTLIGRLLHDSHQLTEDQIQALEPKGVEAGPRRLNLSYATDGLRAERQQGITIDVAYRYATTEAARLVIADCPGHLVYTANMATGASTAEVALVVVDVTRGLREQTRRHLALAILFGVRRVVVAVNKMDLVGWSEPAWRATVDQVEEVVRRLGGAAVTAVPVSALHGDNVVEFSREASWYRGVTVMGCLRPTPERVSSSGARLPVQLVVPGAQEEAWGAGLLSGGPIALGDPVVVLPIGQVSHVRGLSALGSPVPRALVGRSIQILLDDGVALHRGDMVSEVGRAAAVVVEADTTLCWFDRSPARPGRRFLIKHTTRFVEAVISAVEGRRDLTSMEVRPASEVGMNDIGLVRWEFETPLPLDSYRSNRTTGSFIAVDSRSGRTLGAAMVASSPAKLPGG